MDTKLRSSDNIRIVLTVLILLAVSVVNICIFPGIIGRAELQKAKDEDVYSDIRINSDTLAALYRGSYVLYLDNKQRQDDNLSASDLFLTKKGADTDEEESADAVSSYLKGTMTRWYEQFNSYSMELDYYSTDGSSIDTNTEMDLAAVLQGSISMELMQELEERYAECFIMTFDNNGVLKTDVIVSTSDKAADKLIKIFQQMDREQELQDTLNKYSSAYRVIKIKNFQIVYGIMKETHEDLLVYSTDNWYANYWLYRDAGGLLYTATLIALAAAVLLMSSKRIWKDISYNRKGKWYLFELACVGVMMSFAFVEIFVQQIQQVAVLGIRTAADMWITARQNGFDLVMCLVVLMLLYGTWYASLLVLRPVFSLGVREYIRQYSWLYQICLWTRKRWNGLKYEVNHIDFSEKSVKTIGKMVLVNFFVLAVFSFFWFFGIFALISYSIVVFLWIKKYYDKAGKDYQTLLKAMNHIAEGKLDMKITEDVGVFEPFKGELEKISDGFQKAVAEEVKSQRMKTELITNVSHDLKTPLTAITTYIELLKKGGITEEERASYIETLEKKSLRLKSLIEDLFEVSKTASNNITLQLMDVDIVNLIKQVSVEHEDEFRAMGLDLRLRVPEEKVVLYLDNQKTYRIFENLFSNMQKYAMPGSRGYVDVAKEKGDVVITMRNMSAEELKVSPEELTERFVRGDASRNTDGSGLGLAIAKGFTQAQGGDFEVAVDGDLFKVTIHWKMPEGGIPSADKGNENHRSTINEQNLEKNAEDGKRSDKEIEAMLE